MPYDQRPIHVRTTFDEVAAEYDDVRPGYPAALIDDIVRLAALPSPADILEIGCGTGQATKPFAERGDNVVCLDIGAALLAVAQAKFAANQHISFHHAAFEDWHADGCTFDLVMSATAFHWVAPDVGYPKAAALLNNTGSLAIFANEHEPLDPAFAAAMYGIEQKIVPDWPDPRNAPDLRQSIRDTAAAIDATGLFAPVIVRTYPWTQSYPTAEYLRLHNTYSNYRSLNEATRVRLFAAIANLIEQQSAGVYTKRYLAVLYLAHKKPETA